MSETSNLEKLAKRLRLSHGVLAGTVNTQSITCGNPNCGCMDKRNPRKHSCHKLSYSANGKTRAITLKKCDVEKAVAMTNTYRELRELTLKAGREMAELVREHGVVKAEDIALSLSTESAPATKSVEPSQLRVVATSRDKWKSKALSRQKDLERRRVRVRDLETSRAKWRSKFNEAVQENKRLQSRLAVAEKKMLEIEDRPVNKKN